MLDTIYNFLFTPIMSKAFMGLFYGVKPVSIAIIFTLVCVFLIVAVIVLNRLDKGSFGRVFDTMESSSSILNHLEKIEANTKLSNDFITNIDNRHFHSNIYNKKINRSN